MSDARRMLSASVRVMGALLSLCDPRLYLHAFRIIHFYGYSHVRPRSRLSMQAGSRMAPNVSIRNGCRILIGRETRIGERCYLWAGDISGKIIIGNYVSLGPEVFVTASDYQFGSHERFRTQPKREEDVVVGDDVWLGARVVVTAGVRIGDGCIVGAGAVVTRDLPPGTIAVGVPARVVAERSSTRFENER